MNLLELAEAFYSEEQPGKSDQNLIETCNRWVVKNRIPYEQVFSELLAAVLKYAEYSCLVGFFYHRGLGTQKDLPAAFSWYKKAAEAGDEFAQYQLAYCYRKARGTPRDYNLSLYWLKKSAESGYVNSQSLLGNVYLRGAWGIRRDKRKSFLWNKLAAAAGNQEARDMLGHFYLDGQGTDMDLHQALRWYSKMNSPLIIQSDFTFTSNSRLQSLYLTGLIRFYRS
ncbi:hypothetical protein G9A89_021732 [Geosiphon pyriformis]|nr:hypothetical protein G9A89_021732 [Geosiphon pyriformis]